jgi:subtilisin family serine protease
LVRIMKTYLSRHQRKHACVLLLILFLMTACGANQNQLWYKESMEFDRMTEFDESSQTIAFIDTYNAFDGSQNVADDNGHGTAVTSIACGNGYHDVEGLAPNAKIIVIKAADSEGRMDFDNLMKALEYAQKKKADVVNISLGGHKSSKKIREKIMGMYQEGMTVIAPTGDYDQKDLLFPASVSPYVVSVAALTKDGELLEESNTGKGLLCAFPGSKIEALDEEFRKCLIDGSSEAAALAAAYVAKLKGTYLCRHNRSLPNEDVIHVLDSLNSQRDYLEPFDQI